MSVKLFYAKINPLITTYRPYQEYHKLEGYVELKHYPGCDWTTKKIYIHSFYNNELPNTVYQFVFNPYDQKYKDCARFDRSLGGDLEKWDFSIELDNVGQKDVSLSFYIEYTFQKDGHIETYWDNNDNKNYTIGISPNLTPNFSIPCLTLGKSTIALYTSPELIASHGSYVSNLDIYLKDLEYNKDVEIRHWDSANSPTNSSLYWVKDFKFAKNNEELWQLSSGTSIPRPEDFCFFSTYKPYNSNPYTCWDNNFGNDYHV